MDKKVNTKVIGDLAFFFSGICTISSGVVVSILQEQYGFAYGMTGTLLSLMNIGNLVAAFLTGMLPNFIGTKLTVLILCSGFGLGYLSMGISGALVLLMMDFLFLGLAKGCALNTCTVLVGSHSENRTKNLNLMHAFYACGALLSPVVISLSRKTSEKMPMIILALLGVVMWGLFAMAGLAGKTKTSGSDQIVQEETKDRAFLHDKKFWLLTCLLFCQIAAEGSVTGWLVTYYKGSGLLSAEISPYTVTVMWGATLIARLLIAFVFPIKDRFRTLAVMGITCTILYIALMFSGNGVVAIILLFLFAFSMAGVNPTVVAGAGNILNAESMGVMLPVAGAGAIIMPWLIGVVAEKVSLQAGMCTNVIPCLGIFVFSVLCKNFTKE